MLVHLLDHGSVELLDTFGSDLMVVNAAHVRLKNSDENNCVNPFFHPQAQFRIKMPIFVAREWFRHQIGFARNELRRYVDEKPVCYLPCLDAKLKQRNKEMGNNIMAMEIIKDINERACESYGDLLAMGIAPELARTVLPQGMYTEFIETGSLSAFVHLCKIRLDPTAQWEIRQYADAVRTLLMDKFPVSWAALAASD